MQTDDGARVFSLPYAASSDETKYEMKRLPLGGGFGIVVRDIFSPAECKALILATEVLGYDRALVNYGTEQVYDPSVRNCERCMVDDPLFAHELVRRLAPYFPTALDIEYAHAHGFRKINRRMRFVRYAPGQFFDRHYDGEYHDTADDTVSLVTLQLYLDEGMIGGDTVFFTGGGTFEVRPMVGSVLMFDQQLEHEGSKVLHGNKHILRTELMYEA